MARRKNIYQDDFGKFLYLILLISVFGLYIKYKDFWETYSYWILGLLAILVLCLFLFLYHGYLFSKHSKATWYALKFQKSLKRYGVESKTEHYDGHKHVDIYIPEASIAIEVDGKQHYTSAKQIESDFGRKRGSIQRGVDTIHIPNVLIRSDRKRIARAIAEVVRNRINGKK